MATTSAAPNPILEAAAAEAARTSANANAAMETQRAAIEQNRSAQLANMNTVQDLGSVLNSAIQETAKNDQIIKNAELVNQMQEEQFTMQATKSLASAENIGRQINELMAAEVKLKDAEKAVQQQTAEQGPLETFFNGIVNQTIYGDSRGRAGVELEQAANQFNNAFVTLETTSSAVDKVANIADKTHSAVNEGYINASLRSIEEDAKARIALSDLNIAQSNGATLAALASADTRVAETYIQQYQMAATEQGRLEQNERFKVQMAQEEANYTIRVAEHEQSKKQFKITEKLAGFEVATLEFEAKQREIHAKFENTAVNNISHVVASAGAPAYTRETILKGLNSPDAATRAYWNRLNLVGGARDPVNGVVWADNAYDAFTLMATIPGANNKQLEWYREVDKKVKEKFMVRNPNAPATGSGASAQTALVYTAPNEETYKAEFNKMVDEMDATYAANPESGEATNWHAAPPTATVMAQPKVQATPLYQNVLKHYKATHIRAEEVLTYSAAGVVSKSVTANQAVDGIMTLFQAAQTSNLADNGGILRAGFPTSRIGNYMVDINMQDSGININSQFQTEPLHTISRSAVQKTGTAVATAGLGLMAGGVTSPVGVGTFTAGQMILGFGLLLPKDSIQRFNMKNREDVERLVTIFTARAMKQQSAQPKLEVENTQ